LKYSITIMSTPSSSRAPSVAAAAAAQHGGQPKIPLPVPFDGTRTKLRPFLAQAELYIGFNILQFPADDRKVLWVTSLLSGAAFNWVETYLTDYLENAARPADQEVATRRLFGSFSNFKEDITKVFGDIDPNRTAERIIQNLKQTGSAISYSSDFQQYAGRTDWNDEALSAQFYRGLKEHVKDEIARRDRPDTLEGMIETAVKIDNRVFERNLEKRGHYNGGHEKKKKGHHGRWNSPMELDAIQKKPFRKSNNGPRKPLSKDEAQRRKEKGLCYECGLPGHMASSHRQGKPWKGNRQVNAIEKREVNVVGRIKEMTTDELEEQQIHTQVESDDEVEYGGPAICEKALGKNYEKKIRERDITREEAMELHRLYQERDRKHETAVKAAFKEVAAKTALKRKALEQLTKTDTEAETSTTNAESDSSGTLERFSELTISEEEDMQAQLSRVDQERSQKQQALKEQRNIAAKEWDEITKDGKIPRTQVTHIKHPLHDQLSWASCYHDQCQAHYDAKNRSNYFPSTKREVHWEDKVRDICMINFKQEQRHQLKCQIQIGNVTLTAMIDSGAQGNYIHPAMLGKYSIPVNLKRKPYEVVLADGEGNTWIRRETPLMEMRMPDGHTELIALDSMDIGRHDVILGAPWIRKHNPEINWENDSLQFSRCACKASTK